MGVFSKRLRLLAIFLLSSGFVLAQEHEVPGGEINQAPNTEVAVHSEKLDPGKIIVEHVTDAHDFHITTIGDHPISIPLPVILYSPQRGFTVFSSAKFHHGHEVYQGYQLIDDHFKEKVKAAGGDEKGLMNQHIVAVNEQGLPDNTIKVFDFSLTKNAVQMLLASIVLLIIMISIAGKYKANGPNKAPSGFQNALEPVITFVRDDVAKPNLGHKYKRYLPLLLTIFFFILINNLFGLIPGSANVTGNIALTGVLATISLVVILFSTNKHYWAHVFWFPGVPIPVKLMMLPVELMGIITKPFALMIRLFANMVAGHVIILSFIILIFIFGAMNTALGFGSSPIFIALAVFIYAIEVLVAFIQAFIFTNLTAVFIGQAFEHGDHADDHEHKPH